MRRCDPSPGPHCPRCGYSLFALPKPRCPECGFKARSSADAVELRDWRRRMRIADSGRCPVQLLNAIAFAVLAGGLATLTAAVMSFGLFLLIALPALCAGLPVIYFQWSTGQCVWKVWLPLGILWAGLGFLLLFIA